MPKHIILMVLDCLREDYTNNQELMPFLNELKKDSLVFNKAYAIAPATNFAMSSILTGKNPLEIENDWHITEKKRKHYLTNKLKDFHKICITGNIVTCRKFGFDVGFDYFEDFLHEKKSVIKRQQFTRFAIKCSKLIKNKKAYNLLKKVYSRIQDRLLKNPNLDIGLKIRFKKIANVFFDKLQADKNTFSFLHFIDPHTPYLSANIKDKNIIKKTAHLTRKLYDLANKDRKSSRQFTDEERNFLLKRYEEEVIDLDRHLKEFVEQIKSKIDWDDTLLILTSDHGEAFGETGYMNHPVYRVSNKHHIQVPLIIAGGLAKKLDIIKANDVIWNKDLHDIILNMAADRTEIKLKENKFTYGIKKKDNHFVICSLFNPATNEIRETEEDLSKSDRYAPFLGFIQTAKPFKEDTLIKQIKI